MLERSVSSITEYRAVVANKFAIENWSQSREGINCTQEEFEKLAYKINSDIAEKKLSPYQCSVSMKEESVSPSTIYRWIDYGYAGLSNLDLRKWKINPGVKIMNVKLHRIKFNISMQFFDS